MCLAIQEKILGLNISVANAKTMNVRESSCKLIHVHLDVDRIQQLSVLAVTSRDFIHCLWDILKNEIEINFILLFSRGVEAVLQVYYILMP